MRTPDAGGTAFIANSSSRAAESQVVTEPRTKAVATGYTPTHATETNEVDNESIYSVEFKNKAYCERMAILGKNAAYVSTVLGISSLFFMMSGI